MSYSNETSIELCRTMLKRSAWKIAYRTRKQHLKESLCLYDYHGAECSFDGDLISGIYVEDLINKIPWTKCRLVIWGLIIEGKTEKEVAAELGISQQGVNKWKKAGVELLRQRVLHSQKY